MCSKFNCFWWIYYSLNFCTLYLFVIFTIFLVDSFFAISGIFISTIALLSGIFTKKKFFHNSLNYNSPVPVPVPVEKVLQYRWGYIFIIWFGEKHEIVVFAFVGYWWLFVVEQIITKKFHIYFQISIIIYNTCNFLLFDCSKYDY